MHGRLKLKTTAEQEAEKQKERQQKLTLYRGACQKAAKKRELQEYDSEGLGLTSQLLQANPDHYTLWNFRKEIILFIKSEKNDDEFQEVLDGEMHLTEACLRKNRKSYGAWHHRAWALKLMPKPDWKKELLICGKTLQLDERNFHCWDYRRAVCRLALVNPVDELSFTMDKIEENFSNYSAWHYRSSLLPLVCPGKNTIGPGIDQETFIKEHELIQNATFTDPNDQSPWFYLRWLLGRAEKAASILYCYVDKENNRIYVVLSKPVKKAEFQNISLLVNDEVSNCDWNTPEDPMYASTVWVSDSLSFSPKEPQNLKVTSNFDGKVEHLEFCTASCDLAWRENLRETLYNLILSAATSEVLQRELESCQQLLDMEPDNKWTLLTCVLLLRAINSQAHEELVLKYLNQLVAIDSSRKCYYNDLRTKCIIENNISLLLTENERKLKLSNQSLTHFCHADHLVFLQHLDLSNNMIVSLHSLRCLVSLQELILDHNSIEDCSGLEKLEDLQCLSLNHNSIPKLENLDPVTACKKLKRLEILHNPVSEATDFAIRLKLRFPNLQI